MEKETLKKILAGLSMAGLLSAATLTVSGCATESRSSCSGDKPAESGKSSCSGEKGGSSCSGEKGGSSCSGEKGGSSCSG